MNSAETPINVRNIGEIIGPSAFTPGDFVVVVDKDISILKVIDKEAHRIKVRKGETTDSVFVEWWTTADKLAYPSDHRFWSPHQKAMMSMGEKRTDSAIANSYPGLLGISNKLLATSFGVLVILSVTSNYLLNQGRVPIHSISNLLGFGALSSAGALAWNAWKQREEFEI